MINRFQQLHISLHQSNSQICRLIDSEHTLSKSPLSLPDILLWAFTPATRLFKSSPISNSTAVGTLVSRLDQNDQDVPSPRDAPVADPSDHSLSTTINNQRLINSTKQWKNANSSLSNHFRYSCHSSHFGIDSKSRISDVSTPPGRCELDGANVLPDLAKKTFIRLFLDAISDKMLAL
jgi:hypothetical protein